MATTTMSAAAIAKQLNDEHMCLEYMVWLKFKMRACVRAGGHTDPQEATQFAQLVLEVQRTREYGMRMACQRLLIGRQYGVAFASPHSSAIMRELKEIAHLSKFTRTHRLMAHM